MTADYSKIYERSINHPDQFWGEAAEAVQWEKKWDTVLDDTNKPFYRWFVGGMLNTCYNALDYHVQNGRGNQTAIIYDSPVTDTVSKITYDELLGKVSTFAGVLRDLGVSKGDTVIIYMPNCHARLCEDRCRAFRGIRRVRAQRTGNPHR